MFRHPIALTALLAFSALPRSSPADEKATSAPATQPVHLLPPDQTINDLKAYLLPLVPKFVTPTDPKAWMDEADKLRERMLKEIVFRGVPEEWYKTPTNVVWGDKLPGKGYTIRKLRYEIVPGFWAGALFYEPDDLKEKVPAILNVNGHVGPEGMSIPYEQIRRINLAKRGMLALGLEWIGMGELSDPDYHHHAGSYLELCGISNVAVHYLALKRGLDILLEHEFTDPDRVGVTGLSGGGWQTIMISSLDTRVKLTVPNAGYIGYEARVLNWPDFGDEEQCPVDMVFVADYVHLTAMLAPRFALQIANEHDTCCFPADRVLASIVEPIRPVYELFGKPENYAFHRNIDPGTHNYERDNREAFYKFVNRHFLPEDQRKDKEVPVDDEVRTQKDLAIYYPKPNGSLYTLVVEAMKDLPETKKPQGQGDALEFWRRKTREALREVIRLPSANPKLMAAAIHTKVPVTANVQTHSWLLQIGDDWIIPVAEMVVAGNKPTFNQLILCDMGRDGAKDLIQQALDAGQRVLVADILCTGECMSAFTDGNTGRWNLGIAALGQRTLGIQAAQLRALTNMIKARYPKLPIHTLTRMRVSGVAALVFTATHPGEWVSLKTVDMESSFKQLLRLKMNDIQSQPIFCPNLLKVADLPDLADLACPTRVELSAK